MGKTPQTTAPAGGSTRDLAYRWIAAVCHEGLNHSAAEALVASDFLLHLPRSTAWLTADAGLDTPRARFGAVTEAVGEHFDIRATTMVSNKIDIFDGDRGGLHYVLRVQPHRYPSFELLVVLTFERTGDHLSAVRVHADTAMLLRGLGLAPDNGVIS